MPYKCMQVGAINTYLKAHGTLVTQAISKVAILDTDNFLCLSLDVPPTLLLCRRP